MTTISINERTKKGKALLEYLKCFDGDFVTFPKYPPDQARIKLQEHYQ